MSGRSGWVLAMTFGIGSMTVGTLAEPAQRGATPPGGFDAHRPPLVFRVDWKESDITVSDLRWRHVDMTKVVEGADGKWVDAPDLSKVDEIGFTDLAVGADHGKGGASRVAWLEVYGKAAPRAGAASGK